VIITGSAISPLQVSGGEQVRVDVGSSTVAVRIA
jgi:hypothetical protein